MPKRKDPTYDEIVANLQAFFNDESKFTLEEAETVLKKAGYELPSLRQKARDVVDRAMAKSPQNWRNRARMEQERAEGNLRNYQGTRLTGTRNDKINTINALVSRSNLSYAFAYRNFERQTDEDLERLYHLLEFLVQQEQNRPSE